MRKPLLALLTASLVSTQALAGGLSAGGNANISQETENNVAVSTGRNATAHAGTLSICDTAIGGDVTISQNTKNNVAVATGRNSSAQAGSTVIGSHRC